MKKCVRFDPMQLRKLAIPALAAALGIAIVVVAVRDIIDEARANRG